MSPLLLIGIFALAAPQAPDDGAAADMVVLDLEAIGVKPAMVEVANRLLPALVADGRALRVLSATDARQMLALEEQKQAANCDDTGCLAEIAGALGARYVVYGSIGRLGSTLVINLNVFDSGGDPPAVFGRSTRNAATEDDVAETLELAVAEALGGLGKAEAQPVAAVDEDAGADMLTSPWLWSGAVVGGVGALVLGSAVVFAGINEASVIDLAVAPEERASASGVARVAWVVAAAAGVVTAVGVGLLGVGAVAP